MGSRRGLLCRDGFPTITKQRILGGQQQMLRLDNERMGARAQGDYDRLLESVLAHLPGCDAVVLSDYAKGVLTPEVCQAVIQAAREAGYSGAGRSRRARTSRAIAGATTVCPNLGELAAVLHLDARDLKPLLEAAEALVQKLDLEFLTATLGEKGIALVRPGNRFLAPAVARQVFDVRARAIR